METGTRVQTPDGLETVTTGEVRAETIIDRDAQGKETGRRDVTLVGVKLDGEAVGYYPENRLELLPPLPDQEG